VVLEWSVNATRHPVLLRLIDPQWSYAFWQITDDFFQYFFLGNLKVFPIFWKASEWAEQMVHAVVKCKKFESFWET
jgi:hypothetical protein